MELGDGYFVMSLHDWGAKQSSLFMYLLAKKAKRACLTLTRLPADQCDIWESWGSQAVHVHVFKRSGSGFNDKILLFGVAIQRIIKSSC